MFFAYLRSVLYTSLLGSMLIALCVLPVQAKDDEEKKALRGNLPPQLEGALSDVLASTSGALPKPAAVDELLRFVAQNTTPDKKLEPKDRPQGKGIYYSTVLSVPLHTVITYLLDPRVPGEALYPSAVRRNTWKQGSEILTSANTLRTSPLPPTSMLVVRGIEEEETTPDTSSGCFYSYTLNRLFVLTAIQGRSALISVSFMPAEASGVGHKGLIVGDDAQWTYVYTQEVGTNIAMMGWAKTYLYGSASIVVYMDSAKKAGQTDVSIFKWTKAGWSGMNVVKPAHITEGVDRFVKGLQAVLQSPHLPTPNAIAARYAELQALDDNALREALEPFAQRLATATDKALKSAPYSTAVNAGNYAAMLQRQDRLSELIKDYMRTALRR